MTRRLRRTLGCAATTALVAASLAGCSSTSTKASSAAPDQTVVLSPAATGDIAKVTWNVYMGEPDTIDPFKSANNTPNMINSNMCEDLLVQTPDFKIKPNLAKSVESPDPLHWVYNLRDDVTFWDGKPMTAEDVAWSLQHNLTDVTTMYNYLYANVKSVAVTGAHQVTVTMKRPDYLFNEELASFAGVVVEKAYYEAHAKSFGTPNGSIMCTGPYEFSKWNKGESIVATKNPHYWNKDLQPKVGEIDFTFLTDDSTITAGLLSGQIDGTYALPTASLEQLRTSNVGHLYFGPSPMNEAMKYSNPHGPMSNPDMRKALQMAIDWKGISDSVFKGSTQVTKLQTPPAVWGFASSALSAYAKTLPEPPSAQYDEAKRLLAKVPASIRKQQITMVAPANMQQFAIAIQDAAQRIGLKFKLTTVPVGQFPNYDVDPKTRGNTDILWEEWWPGTPSPLDWLAATAMPGGFANPYGYDGITSLYQKAIGTADVAKRAALIVQIEKKLHDEMLPTTPGLERESTLWLNNKITGAPASFAYVYYPWAALLGAAGKN